MEYDDFEPDPPEADEPRPPDRKVAEAKAVIMERFFGGGKDVFYSRQIEIWLENDFFHWITKKALRELAAERQIDFTEENL